jgi:uncharacterized membrane protein (GlpM family)
MSQNLNLLRQKYCHPATLSGKETHDLFRLEKECEQGKALFAKAPETFLHLQEFDPYGLQQTYRDDATGVELPVFAVFNLEGDHHLTCEITMDSVPTAGKSKSLPTYMPFARTQTSVMKMNERRMKAQRTVTRISGIVGIFPVLAYLFAHLTATDGVTLPYALLGGCLVSGLIAYLLGLFLLDRLLPWKKLVISAEFNGLLPKEARDKAHAAKGHFDNLYLIVDQQHRWKGTLLPDPRPRALDPLLIGELKRGQCCKFVLIHQFDLTEAEQYLADEFSTKSEETFAL